MTEQQLAIHAHEITERVRSLEVELAQISVACKRVTDVVVTPGVKLAWSGLRKRWRFVLRSESDVIELLHASREERIEVWDSGAVRRLLVQLKQEHLLDDMELN